MAFLRIKRYNTKAENAKQKKQSWYVGSQGSFSLGARLSPEDKEAALIAELRYYEELEAWDRAQSSSLS